MRKLLFPFLFLVSLPLGAQSPYLVKDINTTSSGNLKSSSPSEFGALDSTIFFAATTADAGTELWSSDGSSGSASMVADIIPGTGSSNPSALTALNGLLLFNARDVNHGIELWATDGTAGGTHLITDINPGPNSAQPLSRIVYKNRMLFSADDGTNGRELWTTDGTAAGTRMLKDINPGSASSFPAYPVAFGNSVYFAATGGLWKTDGTEAGTVKVGPVVSIRNLAVAGSQIFFEGVTSGTNWELWVSDGSDAGTHLVTEIRPGPTAAFDSAFSSAGLTPFGNSVLFIADDGVHGREMWISDGTAAGTRMVRDFVPGAKGMWDDEYARITTLGTRAFFSAFDAAHGTELWVTDGTDAGTSFFADLGPGSASSSPFGLVASGGKLFFVAGYGSLGEKIWVTDGTVDGTRSLSNVGFGSAIFYSLWPVNGKIYFNGFSLLAGNEPWVTDGTDAGSRMLANIAADEAPSSLPSMLTGAGNLLFFNANDGITPTSLWRTDGTESGTIKLMETGQHPGLLTAAGPFVFFPLQPIDIVTLYVSDGTPQGTKPADDFLYRFGQWRVGTLFPFGDTVFTTVYDGKFSSASLWKTTTAANAPATPLGAPNPSGLIDVAGRTYFYSTTDGRPVRGLWTTDGTPAGTYAVIPDLGVEQSYDLSDLVNASGTIFFLKRATNQTIKLWKSDGTTDGTTAVKEVASTQSSFIIKAAGRRVFFIASGALWASDGTDAGTIELTKITVPPPQSGPTAAAGNRIVFTEYDAVANRFDLWSSDGTKEGTRLLAKLGSSSPNLTPIDDKVYLTGVDDAHGAEPWITDGTIDGTKMLFDLNPGSANSYAELFTKVGDLLYFRGYTEATGWELWALPLTEPRLSIADTRIAEGDSGTTAARFNVSIAPAAKQAITIDYTTSDGTARAGEDYDAVSGTLTFAPGETSKTIDVRVRGDVAAENNETFFLTLHSTAGARVIKGEATAIIDDDDQTVDLNITPQFNEINDNLYDAVNLSNAGPRAATDIVVKFTSTPVVTSSNCGKPCAVALPQLVPGASLTTSYFYGTPDEQVYLSATATARQRDLQPSNNSTSWTLNAFRTMAMNAAYLVPGATATVSASNTYVPPVPVSSDPSVVSISSGVTKLSDHMVTFTVTALKPGTSTISVDGRQYPLQVTVVAAGSKPRWPGGMTMGTNFTVIRFDQPMTVIVIPTGAAPTGGATATGDVTVSVAGQEIARRTISAAGQVSFPAYLNSLGSNAYVISYAGDANFLPQTVNGTIQVSKGLATLTGGLERLPGIATSFTLTVHAAGSPVAAPTETLAIVNGATEIGRVQLVPSSGGISTARTTLTNLPASPTLTINYLGDSFYGPGSQQVRSIEPRQRSAKH